MPFVGSLQAPPGAVAYRLWSLSLKMGGRTTEGGRPWKNWIATRVLVPAGPDGVAGDVFPVAFGSTEILATFGAGRYRVEWLTEQGKRVGEHMHTFELQAPAGERVPIVEGPDPRQGPPARPGASGLEGMSAFDLLAFLDGRESRVEERMRQSHERDRERDQQFFGLVLQTLKDTATRAQSPGAMGDPDLIRRELRVTVAEQMGHLRAELGADQGGATLDDLPAPKNPEQAAARLGMRFVGELEAALPGLVKHLVPAIVKKLGAAGVQVPAEALNAAAALRGQPDPAGVDAATLEAIAAEAVAGLGEEH